MNAIGPMLRNRWTTIIGVVAGVALYVKDSGLKVPETKQDWWNLVVGAIIAALGVVAKDATVGSQPAKAPPAGKAIVPLLLILPSLLLTSCMGLMPLSNQNASVADQIAALQALGGSSCSLVDLTGTYPGFASGRAIHVQAYDAGVEGKRVTAIECLKALEPQLREMIRTLRGMEVP